ncbi:MAG: LysM peptidoglycan-binding domain-containing protein [Chloroflexota bacterium]|jgi:LysM repeat protein|uniref:LysM peptidoglycan-binding domain-containing protein n=1 Tax=Bellilinea sp. TaxID=2838785 RepID=UPI002ADDC9BB|nr:LysM peptidoglycan-binding domain-containing protein [Bellilinea sp.]
MSGKNSPQSVIDSYRKRQKMMPYLTWGLAGLLVLMGIILIILWVSGGSRPQIALFSSPTPTATSTLTPSPVPPTATVTMTPTETETPTPTLTFTPSGPFEYTVQSGDTCFDLAVKYEVDLLVLLALNNFPAGQCPIREGDKILIPAPNQTLPTETPLPTGLPRGTRIEYVVKTGDTLDYIASLFNSTVDDIMLQNKITDKNLISAGQTLIVRVNLVTPTPTRPPTLTPTAGAQQPTATPSPTSGS